MSMLLFGQKVDSETAMKVGTDVYNKCYPEEMASFSEIIPLGLYSDTSIYYTCQRQRFCNSISRLFC
jgi:hypothetical protein